MPYIIRNAQGLICGRCENRPGPGNLLPDGSPEIVEYIKDDTPESLAFVNRPIPVMQPTLDNGSRIVADALIAHNILPASAFPVPAQAIEDTPA